jgi:plastocyanin
VQAVPLRFSTPRATTAALAAATAGALALTAGAAVVGQARGAGARADAIRTHTVLLTGFEFKPHSLSAKAGDRVRFVWKDGVHNIVTVVGPTRITAKKVTDHRPPLVAKLRRGKYRLICEPHELVGMVITIRVR